MQKIEIKEGWHGLWYRIGAQGHNAWEVYLGLFERYAEEHRYYHAFPHIMQMLKEFEKVKNLCIQPNAVEMALYYHDAIYDLSANDNEEKSAELAVTMLRHARLPEVSINEVSRLILLTKKHKTVPEDMDGSLLIDIDFSILGQPAHVFDAYERNIQKEYAHMLEHEFIRGRADFLRVLLKRKPIYCTPHFHAKYEKVARGNLMRSLKRLE